MNWTFQPGKIRVDPIAGQDRYQVSLVRPAFRFPKAHWLPLLPLFTLRRGPALRAAQWLDRKMGA